MLRLIPVARTTTTTTTDREPIECCTWFSLRDDDDGRLIQVSRRWRPQIASRSKAPIYSDCRVTTMTDREQIKCSDRYRLQGQWGWWIKCSDWFSLQDEGEQLENCCSYLCKDRKYTFVKP
jgi:hypothetical protein